MKKHLLILFLASFSMQAFSLTDISLQYSYEEQKTSTLDESKNFSETYMGNIAFILFGGTALEFNYSRTNDSIVNDSDFNLDTGAGSVTIKEVDGSVVTEVFGVGLRQSLLPRKWFIQPMLSLGYAKQISQSKNIYTYNNGGQDLEITSEGDKVEADSSYVSLSIKFKFSRRFGLTVSGRSVMPEFELSEFGRNVRYTAGISLLL